MKLSDDIRAYCQQEMGGYDTWSPETKLMADQSKKRYDRWAKMAEALEAATERRNTTESRLAKLEARLTALEA